MELGQKLKQARLDAGLSQRQLCGDTITRNMLSQIENGSARPSMDTLRYLARQLGKPLSFFLEEQSVSPNQAVLTAARTAFAAKDPRGVLDALQNYQPPDPVFDAELELLRTLSLLSMAENALRDKKHPYARQLLNQAAAPDNLYYTPELERRRLLLLSQADPDNCAAIAHALPADDRELYLRARAALENKDPRRCAQLLDAAEDRTDTLWAILRGDAAFALGDYAQAAQFYRLDDSSQVYAKLEQCYQHLEDYKMAYYYACKQR